MTVDRDRRVFVLDRGARVPREVACDAGSPAGGAASAAAAAAALRDAGAAAVVVVDARDAVPPSRQQHWLDAPHARGAFTADAAPDGDGFAARWGVLLAAGHVAADAALLAWPALPRLGFGDEPGADFAIGGPRAGATRSPAEARPGARGDAPPDRQPDGQPDEHPDRRPDRRPDRPPSPRPEDRPGEPDRPAHPPGDRPADRPADRPGERPGDPPEERPADRPAGARGAWPDGRAADPRGAAARVAPPSDAAPLGLYAIVADAGAVRRVVAAGARTVQLRVKAPADADASWWRAFDAQLRESLAAARDGGALLVVNDHWRRAADHGARAVHLGQDDLAALGAAGRAALRDSGLALGVSSHAVWELCRARALAPSLVACGPVWPTTTKAMPWRPQGLDNLGWWSHHAGVDLVAIGGILTPEQVRVCAAHGAAGVCVLRGLRDDPSSTLPALRRAFEQGRRDATLLAPRGAAVPHPTLQAAP